MDAVQPRAPATLARIAVSAVLGGALLGSATGCTPEEEPSAPEPTETQTPEPTQTLTPEPETGPLVIPACDDLISDDIVKRLENEEWEFAEHEPRHVGMLQISMGPVAIEAMEEAEQEQFCMWGIPNTDALTQVYIAELPAETITTFVAALRGSDYVESESNGAVVFHYEIPQHGLGPSDIWYAFIENAWVVSAPSPLGEHALEGLLAANPSLTR